MKKCIELVISKNLCIIYGKCPKAFLFFYFVYALLN